MSVPLPDHSDSVHSIAMEAGVDRSRVGTTDSGCAEMFDNDV